VSTPRAVGVRAAYASIPVEVRDWVEATLGSPVVETAEQVGGMSPGCATRVVCRDGTRAFLKAVGAELNPDTPNLFRREALILGLIGRHELWAGLHASYDDGGWVALLLDDIDGRHPDLRDDTTMNQLLEATDELGQVLVERVPDPPPPDPTNGGLNHMSRAYRAWREALAAAPSLPDGLVPPWVQDHRDVLLARIAAIEANPAQRLVHWDVRNDNLLVRPDGRLVFVDWGMAGLGPAWLDPLFARLERVEDPWFDASLARSPALAAAGDDVVTTWLAAVGTFLAWRSHTAVDVNLPTLNDFRKRESARFFVAAARRLGVPADLGARERRC
jgi:Phosphotransferase enzyme family